MRDAKKAQTSRIPGALKSDGSDMGLVKIHENVIAAIARKAACSVNGVIRIAGSPLVDNIAEIIGNRRIGDRSIAIDISGDAVAIEIKLNISYGSHLPTVAANVQAAIMREVEKMTGMTVTNVNVIVQELDTEEREDEI
ncbi:MAG: Asp23/Gls24 family envelope stress response protein [Lentisphaerae bacterium]|nr:Asp23/Gls24 family envelope stress response protein [Lentisphaerota bacterium]